MLWRNSVTEMVEKWNRDGGTVEHLMVEQGIRNGATIMVQQSWWNSGPADGGTVEQSWWNSGTSDGGIAEHVVEEWNI